MENRYTVLEAAKLLGLTRGRILQMIWDGTIEPEREETPYVPTGFVYKISASELRRIEKERNNGRS